MHEQAARRHDRAIAGGDRRHSEHSDLATRRERILAAAIQLFAERGFDGVATRDIAAAAGIKHPLLFYHFGNKADLYLAAVQDQLNKLAEGLNLALADQRDAQARLRSFVEVYLTYFTEYEPGLTVTLRELHGLPAHIASAISMAHHRQVTAHLEEILASGVASGTFRPLNVAACALTVVGILHTFIRAQARAPGRFTRAEALEQVLDCYAAGLLSEVTRMGCSPAARA